jgi:hypothetical protein
MPELLTTQIVSDSKMSLHSRHRQTRAPIRKPQMRTTSIHLPSDLLDLLRLVAVIRASRRGGGRPSVSDIIRDLLELHRHKLESEVGR